MNEQELKKRKNTNSKILTFFGVIFLLITAALFFMPKSEKTPEELAQELEQNFIEVIKEASSDVYNVKIHSYAETGDNCQIYLYRMGSTPFYQIGQEVFSIFRTIKEKNLLSNMRDYLFFVNDLDANDKDILFMKIGWKGSELNKIDLKNIDSIKILNYAETVDLEYNAIPKFLEFIEKHQSETKGFSQTAYEQNKINIERVMQSQ